MIYWAQLLHFYQPPVQSHAVLARIADESYRPLLRVLEERPWVRLAVNINAVLTELLVEHGLTDVIDSLRRLADRGQVELVGSGKYHPILPLIPEDERERSIAENARTNRHILGEAWAPRGFFPPEMAYGDEILESVASSGHDWVIVSGVACPTAWPTNAIHRVRASQRDLHVLFRDDGTSNAISFRQTDPERFVSSLQRNHDHGDHYVVTAMDAETYGHHISGWEREFLAATYDLLAEQGASLTGRRVQVVTPGELLDLFPGGPHVEPYPSSWSTSRDDIAATNPYPLWRSPGNPVHEAQWDYVQHCLDVLAVAQRYATTPESCRFATIASERLQPALHSCQFWWASQRPMWDPPMVLRGLLLLNETLVLAGRAVHFGTAPERVKREVTWRLAAANTARDAIERRLLTEGTP